MSRARLGIFEGKKAVYNRAILKALNNYGPLSKWELAKKLRDMLHPSISGETAYAKSLKIYSVLIRKGGRLEELLKKEFITKVTSNGETKYALTIKGLIALYLHKPTPLLLEDLVDRMFTVIERKLGCEGYFSNLPQLVQLIFRQPLRRLLESVLHDIAYKVNIEYISKVELEDLLAIKLMENITTFIKEAEKAAEKHLSKLNVEEKIKTLKALRYVIEKVMEIKRGEIRELQATLNMLIELRMQLVSVLKQLKKVNKRGELVGSSP